MNANEAFNKLRANPREFLKYHPVNPGGSNAAHTAGQANLYQFRLYKRDATTPGPAPSGKPAHFGATRPGVFGTREVSSFLIKTTPAPPNVTERIFNGLSVPLHTYNTVTVGSLNHYVVDGQPDGVMVTGQLSGCTFAWVPVGGNLHCIHVQPVGIGALPLHNLMNTSGRFTAHPTSPLHTYGRNDYPSYANVIGVRKGGQWKLYAQHSSDQFRTITAARRIYPGPVTPL